MAGIAGAGGGGIVSMAQIVMSDVVSLRDRYTNLLYTLLYSDTFTRGKYQGIIGVVVALGYGIGPLIGGVLSEKVTWRVSVWPPSLPRSTLISSISGAAGSPYRYRYVGFWSSHSSFLSKTLRGT